MRTSSKSRTLDTGFSERARQEALSLVDRTNDDQESVLFALWMLKAYDQMIDVVTDNPTVFWARDDAAWLKSPGRTDFECR